MFFFIIGTSYVPIMKITLTGNAENSKIVSELGPYDNKCILNTSQKQGNFAVIQV